MGEDRRNPDHVREIVRQAVEEFGPAVIKETLTHFGFDLSDPIAAQRQQQFLREAMVREADPTVQRQRAWLKDTVERCDAFYNNMTSMAMKAIVTAIFGIFGLGIIAWLQRHIPWK